MVYKGSMLPEMIRRALRYAFSGRPGPVHLNLPRDVMGEEIDLDLRKVRELPGLASTLRQREHQKGIYIPVRS